MDSILDDEFVIQMDDSPPFSWIRQTTNRFMTCVVGRKIDHLYVEAAGNAQIIATMASDLIGKQKVEVQPFSFHSTGDEICIISYSGQLKEAIKSVELSEARGIVASSGGMIKSLARKKGWDYVPLPKGYSTSFLFPEIFGCLMSLFGMKVDIPDLEAFIEKNSPSEIADFNEAKQLASLMERKRFKILHDAKSEGIARMFAHMFSTYGGTDTTLEYEPDTKLKPESGEDNIGIISFSNRADAGGNKLVGNFPYNCSSVGGYVKNVIVGEFASIYLGLLKSKEIELFDREVE